MRRPCLGMAAALMMIGQAAPAERCTPVNVAAEHTIEGHWLSLTLKQGQRQFAAERGAVRPKLQVGAEVDVCFESSREGFVSLWSHPADQGAPVRILPNEYIRAEDDKLGVAVQPGVSRCFSELAAGKRVYLKVNKPLGQAELYLHFAENTQGQIAPGDFPSVGNKSIDKSILPASCDNDNHDGKANPSTPTLPYASKALQYEVVR